MGDALAKFAINYVWISIILNFITKNIKIINPFIMDDRQKIQHHIDEVLKELDQMFSVLAQTKRFSPTSKLRYLVNPQAGAVGGIINGLLEGKADEREAKKINKFVNTNIYKEFNFFDLGHNLINISSDLCESQANLQYLIDKGDPNYFGNVRLIIDKINACLKKWEKISPKMTECENAIQDKEKDNDINNMQIGLYVHSSILKNYILMDI